MVQVTINIIVESMIKKYKRHEVLSIPLRGLQSGWGTEYTHTKANCMLLPLSQVDNLEEASPGAM